MKMKALKTMELYFFWLSSTSYWYWLVRLQVHSTCAETAHSGRQTAAKTHRLGGRWIAAGPVSPQGLQHCTACLVKITSG